MLKVSVALATYNGEIYIREQLKSLAAQIRRPDEVIITDDCSTDKTVEIIKAFIAENDLDWQLFESKSNLGFKKNFRKALSLVTGDIVFLCDQDDIWCEDKIESLLNVFAANPTVKAVNSSFTVIDGDGNESALTEQRGKTNYGMLPPLKKQLERVHFKDVFRRNISPGCTMAVTSALAKDYVRLTACELPHDWELNLMAACDHALWFSNAPLINYRIHEANAIGLAVKKQSRTEISAEKAKAAAAIKRYSGKESVYNLCEKRHRALEKESLFGVLSLWLSRYYYRLFPLRERVGDILYVFGRR